jgi:hypothetical protein
MKNIYLDVAIIAMVLANTGIVFANDPRVAYAIPYLTPDPSLKTTDPLYGSMGAEYYGPVATDGYTLPPIFDQNVDVKDLVGEPENKSLVRSDLSSDPWMSNKAHNVKMDSETKHITALSSYDVTEDQLVRGNITLGSESWL